MRWVFFAVWILPAVVTFFLSTFLAKWGGRWRAVDRTGSPPGVVSRLGGVGVVLGVIVGVLGVGFFLYDSFPFSKQIAFWGFCALFVFFVGLLDDFLNLSPFVKLFLLAIPSSLFVLLGGGRVPYLTHPITGDPIPLGWWGDLLAFFWIFVLTNAYNLVDGLDLLAPLLALLPLSFLLLSTFLWGSSDLLFWILPVFSSLLGFLFLNRPPAKIHLGDGGSYFLGFHLGVTSLLFNEKSGTAFAVFAPITFFVVPVLDLFIAAVRRFFAPGLSFWDRFVAPFKRDEEHIHHIFSLAYSPRRTLWILGSFSFLFSFLGFSLAWVRDPVSVRVVFLLFLLILFVFLYWLLYARKRRRGIEKVRI